MKIEQIIIQGVHQDFAITQNVEKCCNGQN